MEGLLYFPMINVPESSWFTKNLLYWDAAGAIIPEQFMLEPERMSPQMRGLLQNELVMNAYPASAHEAFYFAFEQYVDSLDNVELSRRRSNLQAGRVTFLHQEKLLTPVIPSSLEGRGLAEPGREGWWYAIEETTAREWTTALALGLCHPESRWSLYQRSERNIDRWCPVTDRPLAMETLLSGFDENRGLWPRLQLRVNGENKLGTLRVQVLDELLPIPDEPIDPERIAAFKRRHGNLLPSLRKYLESELERAAELSDPALTVRKVDRLVDEGRERIEQARRYLKEAGFRRVADSTILHLAKCVPTLSGPIGAVQGAAGPELRRARAFETEPLAYLALAGVEFKVEPRSSAYEGISLVSFIESHLLGPGYTSEEEWLREDAEAAAELELELEEDDW